VTGEMGESQSHPGPSTHLYNRCLHPDLTAGAGRVQSVPMSCSLNPGPGQQCQRPAPSRYPSGAPSPRTSSRRCPAPWRPVPEDRGLPPQPFSSAHLGPGPPWPWPWPRSSPSPGCHSRHCPNSLLVSSSLFPPEHLCAGLGVLTSCSAPASSPQEWSVTCCLVGLTH
jgi:hypothetical protein